MPRVTLFTKRGCHLCEAVEQAVAVVRGRRPFDLEVRNILDDPADLQKYQHEIPVVLVNGVEVARHRMTAEELEASLARELC
jgi:glutaredoxin